MNKSDLLNALLCMTVGSRTTFTLNEELTKDDIEWLDHELEERRISDKAFQFSKDKNHRNIITVDCYTPND